MIRHRIGIAHRISIHALREEGDIAGPDPDRHLRDFYPRPPRGGRHKHAAAKNDGPKFLSTPSARRATRRSSPRPSKASRFLSTPSARRATASCSPTPSNTKNFYPRPPRGGRRVHRLHPRGTQQFLSTPSARRATQQAGRRKRLHSISIHALREEGDLAIGSEAWLKVVFLSTPSARRATDHRPDLRLRRAISIHALREEGDQDFLVGMGDTLKFLSTPSARRATKAPP